MSLIINAVKGMTNDNRLSIVKDMKLDSQVQSLGYPYQLHNSSTQVSSNMMKNLGSS